MNETFDSLVDLVNELSQKTATFTKHVATQHERLIRLITILELRTRKIEDRVSALEAVKEKERCL